LPILSKAMIYFLFGKDTFRLKSKLGEMIKKYREIHPSGLNLKIFDLEEKNFSDFEKEFQISPMFSEKKLFVFKNASKNKNFQERFLKEIEGFARSKEILVFCEEGEIQTNDFFESLKKFGKFQEFQPLRDWRLRFWVKKEFEKYQGKIEERAIKELIERVGEDLWRMEEEIKKLVSYRKGEEIKVEDVSLLVSPNVDLDIFRMLDHFASGERKKTLPLLKSHLEKGESPFYLLTMIRYQLKNLFLAKTNSLGHLPLFIKRKLLFLSKKFETSELKRIYQKTFEIEAKIKLGKIDPEIALTLFLAGR
jgi:DNA polymerase-3 subunit delta